MTGMISWNYLILLTDLLTPDLDKPGHSRGNRQDT
jgi:hypothetical protein